MENQKSHEGVQEFHLPEWETTSRQHGGKQAQNGQMSSVKERASIIFDRVMPKYKKYLGFSRKTACIIIIVLFLILIALILGLAIGLGRKSSRYDTTLTQRGILEVLYLKYHLTQPPSESPPGLAKLHRRSHLLRPWTWCLRHHLVRRRQHCIHQSFYL